MLNGIFMNSMKVSHPLYSYLARPLDTTTHSEEQLREVAIGLQNSGHCFPLGGACPVSGDTQSCSSPVATLSFTTGFFELHNTSETLTTHAHSSL
jgi:hypothetical protein